MSLEELISITNNAVKSLVRSNTSSPNRSINGATDKLDFQCAGSPFDSPRSNTSSSNKNDCRTKAVKTASDLKVADLSKKSTQTPRHSESNSINPDEPECSQPEDITVIEIIPLEEIKPEAHQNNKDLNTNCSVSATVTDIKKRKDLAFPRSTISTRDSINSKRSQKSSKYNVQCHVKKEQVSTNNSPRPAQSDADKSTDRFSVSSDQPEIIDVYEKIKTTTSELSSTSVSSDQPEIIDVYEKIKTTTSELSSTSGSLKQMADKEESRNLPASDDYFRQYLVSGKSDSKSAGLRQGRMKSSPVEGFQCKVNDDVYISQFGLTDKQRDLKQQLAKRCDSKKPVKKFVQSKIVQAKILTDEETDQESFKPEAHTIPHSSSNVAITAAAAASAAVAAAQPLLKIQHELETKIGQLLSQISELQEKKSAHVGDRHPDESGERIQWLEKQMAELNERRMEHLETLQQQQFQMQAQLLSMTRSRNRSPGSHITFSGHPITSHIPQVSIKERDPTFEHRTGASQPPLPVNSGLGYSRRSQPYYNPETISKHQSYLNEVRELQGSHLDTPAPRDKIPKPAPYTLLQEPNKNLGFLQEILNHKDTENPDTTFNVRGGYSSPTMQQALDRNNSARGRRSEKSPVDTARRLVNTLSDLEHETAASIWTNKSPARDSVLKSHNEPAPLDRYLNYPHNEGTPYPKLHHHSRERKAQELHLENLSEAKAVMKQLELTRETLESNLQQVLRSRRDMNIFTTLASSSLESQVEEQKKIEAMVNKKISSLQEDIQREVLRGLAQQETDILATKVEAPRQKTVARKGTAKQEINRGKAQAEYMARLAVSKSNVPHYTSDMASRGKENRTSKVKPPPKVAMIKDEKTLTRTYGKLEHQRGRTTIRDPYLHFKNPKTGRAARPAPVNESFVSGEGRSRSPPRHHRENPLESPAPRQFYFSPTRGYIPLGAGDTAPIPGQLIHMAIPLGQPRMEPGVRRSDMPMTMTGAANPVTSTPVPVTAARNVALISFPVEEDKKKKGREPELAKQVLPPIDIDSISPSSSQRSDIHIRSPQQGNVNMTFLQNMHDEKSELDLDKTMIEDNSVLEQSGEGIQLPGYEPKVSDHFGPEFPPPTSRPGPGWAAGDGQGRQSGVLVSDVMAEDLRRRDALENNAIYWLEQELMARVLSQVMPLHPQPDTNPDLNGSDVSDKEDSLLVADMIGQGGLQLFIDAGQPVNSALVQALIKEVLQEKISSMLAQRSVDGQTQAGEVKSDSDIEARGQDEPQRVLTPQPTPPASPVRSPGPALTRNVATPPESPPPAGHKFVLEEMAPELTQSPVRRMQSPPRPLRQADLESETEISESIDISEELRRVGASKHAPEEPSEPVSIRHDVATPPFSPVPVIQAEAPPPRVTTPPTSPRQQLCATVATNEVKAAQEEDAKEKEENKEDDEEDMIEQDQPKPIMMSVALGRDEPMTLDMPDTVKAPSPTQKPQEAPGSPDLSSLSSDSSLTETINEVFSDGQWLLSDGEAVGVPLNHAKRKELLLHRNHKRTGDVSSASTLRDTEDLAADDYDFPQSEGEILIIGLPAPEEDSMLDLLAELQRNPFEAAHKDLPGPHVRQILSGPQPRMVMSNTGRSLGETSIGQVPPSQMAMETRNRERQVTDQEANHLNSDSYQRTTYTKTEKTISQDEPRKPHSPNPSPKVDRSSRSPSPRQKTRPTLTNQRTTHSPSPQKKLQIDSRGRPRAHLQYQPVLSDGAPKPTRGKTQLSLGRRSSDSWLSQNSDRGMRGSRSSYLTESVSRSADSPSFRRTGEGAILTSSLKSRNSAGVKKSVEFDLSGTYERTRDSSGPLTDYSQSYSQSFGMTDSLEDSLDESELKNIGQSTEYRSGMERLTLRIPSSADGGDSDLSEIDLTNNS